ncbi:MAG: HAMP domain-containing protein [Lachnospiraceae bacterium]|nr:HAMP domain-containing protein [Lachnospiraceae bacterium]
MSEAEKKGWSIKNKILLLVLGIAVFLSAAILIWVRTILTRVMEEQLEDRARAIAIDLASRSVDLVLTHDIYRLNSLMKDTMENYENLQYIFVRDVNGGVLLSSRPGQEVSAQLERANESRSADGYVTANIRVLSTEEGRIVDCAAPLFQEMGMEVRLGMNYDSVEQVLGNVTLRIGLMMFFVCGTAMLMAAFIMSILLKPIRQLVELTKEVSEGNLKVRIPEFRRDEIGQLTQSFHEMLDELTTKEEIRCQLLSKLMRVQEEERKRIARELHDETSHSLTAILMEVSFLKDKESEEWEEHLIRIKALISETLEDVNTMAWNLRPSVLDRFGLKTTLERYTEEVVSGQSFTLELIMEGRLEVLEPDVETAIFRMVQESLTNIVKYASASVVSVILIVSEAFVSVVVEDDGVGFDTTYFGTADWSRSHLGLLGMRERVELLEGVLRIESSPGEGTAILARIPLPCKMPGGDAEYPEGEKGGVR